MNRYPCIDCGEPVERTGKAGPPPKRCASCKREVQRSRNRTRIRGGRTACVICGGPFERRRGPKVRCRSCRDREQEAERLRRQRTCEQCGSSFESARQARTCSDTCRQKLYYSENPEGYRRRGREWRAKNPEKHRQSAIAAKRRRRVEDPEAAREADRKWREANPEAARRKHVRREERKRSDRPSVAPYPEPVGPRRIERIPEEEFARILAAYGDRCAYCGGGFEEWDHVVPIRRGGPETSSNYVPACARHNRSKGARLLSDWLPDMLAEEGRDWTPGLVLLSALSEEIYAELLGVEVEGLVDLVA